MNKAYALIEGGLTGNNIEQALKTLAEQKDKNLIVWFVVHQILQRINREWEEEVLPSDRVAHLEKKFSSGLLFLIKNINQTDLNSLKDGLAQVITKFTDEYASLSY